MLTIKFESDKENIAKIYTALALNEEVCGANFVMFDEKNAEDCSNPVALFRVKIESDKKACERSGSVAVVDKILFLDSVHIDDKNFFVRAMLFKLQGGANTVLRIGGIHNQLKTFGFVEIDGNMEIETSKINLHSCCKN